MLGEACKVLFPIPEETYFGNKDSSIAVCTLSSIQLLRQIADSDLMDNIVIVGRLFSENRGIDALVRSVNSNQTIKTLIICGSEVQGHMTGAALLALYKHGIDDTGRIITSCSPDPVLNIRKDEVDRFCSLNVVDMIGETNLSALKAMVDSFQS